MHIHTTVKFSEISPLFCRESDNLSISLSLSGPPYHTPLPGHTLTPSHPHSLTPSLFPCRMSWRGTSFPRCRCLTSSQSSTEPLRRCGLHSITVSMATSLLQEYKTHKESFVKKFELTKLPPYLILCVKVGHAHFSRPLTSPPCRGSQRTISLSRRIRPSSTSQSSQGLPHCLKFYLVPPPPWQGY